MKRVLLLRDPSKQRESKAILSPLKVIGVPAFEMRARKVKLPNRVFDYVLITSPQTLRFLKKLPVSKYYLFMGSSSYASSRVSRKISIILKDGHAKKLLAYFRKKRALNIYFPRSAEADPSVVRQLRQMGHRVSVSHPYGLHYLNIRKPVLSALKTGKISSILLTSPSCFLSLKRCFALREMRAWAVSWLVIGPTTRAALKGSKLKIHMASRPSLEGLRQLALKL